MVVYLDSNTTLISVMDDPMDIDSPPLLQAPYFATASAPMFISQADKQDSEHAAKQQVDTDISQHYESVVSLWHQAFDDQRQIFKRYSDLPVDIKTQIASCVMDGWDMLEKIVDPLQRLGRDACNSTVEEAMELLLNYHNVLTAFVSRTPYKKLALSHLETQASGGY